jgi:hypothetical protein
MSKLTRVITSTLFFAIGTGVIFFGGSALLKAPDWITITIYISVVIVGLAFLAIGWAAARGEDIKEMLRDLFSGISF